jgi:acetyl-CoA carboxylase biotin carboxylase subunit
MKIKKVLIANRGEIALRVIKTCRKMGISTVTIYTEEDKYLPHAYKADESYYLGQGTLAETYLNQQKIIDICKDSGADAIHPGYGFLSENTDFCKLVSENNIIFIGPSTYAIELMGDKKTSKQKMQEIGIPLVPGYHGDDQSEELLSAEAKKIGFPVLIKATAGGGGKGMRIVEKEADFQDALAAAKREALNAFSNDKVLIEKYITNPRHIEVQLVSDGQGNHFHFFERECSIQRRYQKVVEETPSPALDDKLRKDVCETAVKIAQGINYVGAGTIEYILTPEKEFYFLEMNTRLQVEHPITEMVTGQDLVALQIKAAAGEAFDFKQDDIKQIGHAVECRIYAEDPDNNFLPTIGKIKEIGRSTEVGVRLDCGFADNTEVSVNYDPMLAKLITYADDRELATEKMCRALNEILFTGIKTNRDYLKRILRHPKYISGDIHTHFIEEEDLAPAKLDDDKLALLIASGIFATTKESSKRNAWDSLLGFRNV